MPELKSLEIKCREVQIVMAFLYHDKAFGLYIIDIFREDKEDLWCFYVIAYCDCADHLTCLLRNLYAGQETTVRTGHGTTD